MGLLYTKKSVM